MATGGNFPMKCPNYCNKEVASYNDLEEHVQVCPFEKVQCDKCGARRARKHFEEHWITNRFEPQYCLQTQFDKLERTLKDMIEIRLKQAEKNLKQLGEDNKAEGEDNFLEQAEDNLKMEQGEDKRLVQVEWLLRTIVVVLVMMLLANIYMANNSEKNFDEKQLDDLKTNITQLWNYTLVNQTVQLQDVKNKQRKLQQQLRKLKTSTSQVWNDTMTNKLDLSQMRNNTLLNLLFYSVQLQDVKNKQRKLQQQLRKLKTNTSQLWNDTMTNKLDINTNLSQLQNDTSVNFTLYTIQLQDVKNKHLQNQQDISQILNQMISSTDQLQVTIETMVLPALEKIGKTNVSSLYLVIESQLTNVEEGLRFLNTKIAEEFINDQQAKEKMQELETEIKSLNYLLNENVTQFHSLRTNLKKDLDTVVALSKNMSSHEYNPWALKLLLWSMSSYHSIEDPVLPIIVRISNFTEKIKNKQREHSKPFYVIEGGHRMCLGIDAAGDRGGEGSHVSVYLYLMKGPYDDKLEQSGEFPFMGMFTIELLNQQIDENHHSQNVSFDCSYFSNCTDRVLEDDKTSKGWGRPQFISQNITDHHNNYLINDSVYFNISYIGKSHSTSWLQMLKLYCDLSSQDIQLAHAPVILNVSTIDEKLENKEKWHSKPFFAFEGGYKMSLIVYVAGDGKGAGTHISVTLVFMKDPYVQSGHFPVRGTFTIQLLNHWNDENHYTRVIEVDDSYTDHCKDVSDPQLATTVCEYQTFIHRYELLESVTYDTSYTSGNNMYFGVQYGDQIVSYSREASSISKMLNKQHAFKQNIIWSNSLNLLSIISSHGNQVVPVVLKMANLSEKLKNKEEWNSDPFFAFEGGYKMCVKVYLSGNDIGEGTHISVYLYLLKGPYDNELEQLGHFPLRGTFTIELLNQLNDENHHTHFVIFDDTGNAYTRVVEGDMSPYGRGRHKFISHDDMLNNKYLTSDNVYFRVMYKS